MALLFEQSVLESSRIGVTAAAATAAAASRTITIRALAGKDERAILLLQVLHFCLEVMDGEAAKGGVRLVDRCDRAQGSLSQRVGLNLLAAGDMWG